MDLVLSRISTTHRQSLADAWDLSTALALLQCESTAELESDVQLCCESLFLDVITRFKSTTAIRVGERYLGEQLGKLAVGLKQPELLDQVLCQRVSWVRLWEIAWLMDHSLLMQLILRNPLVGHELAALLLLGDPRDFSSRQAHMRVGWLWDFDPRRGHITFVHTPTDPITNPILKRVFGAVPPRGAT